MRWYARPEGESQQLKVAPELWSMNKADDQEQIQLRASVDHAVAVLDPSRVAGEWALRLDVGRRTGRKLLDGADLDNYAFPLACRLDDPKLMSVWCTKKYGEHSFVRAEAAREVPRPPAADIFVAKTTGVSYQKTEYKEQVRAAVASAKALPEGAVRLELAFIVSSSTKWWNLWKPTIDALEPLLGRDPLGQTPWCPRDGRITELGMHLTVGPAFRYEVEIGIAATPA